MMTPDLQAALRRETTATPGTVIVASGDVTGFEQQMFAGPHELIADEPVADGGTGKGPSPHQLLQLALAACTSMTIGAYARRKGWAIAPVVVRVSRRREERATEDGFPSGTFVEYFDRTIEHGGALSDDQSERLVEIANKCPVHRTLSHQIEITTALKRAPAP